MSKTTLIFGALAIVGAVLPLSHFLPWLVENGLDRELFRSELFATPISRFFAWDVIVSGVVLVVFILNERRRLKMDGLWLPISGGILIGVSFGLPMFLAMRAHKQHRM